jgi:hypothetical protein
MIHFFEKARKLMHQLFTGTSTFFLLPFQPRHKERARPNLSHSAGWLW